jgi:hypothetical protein
MFSTAELAALLPYQLLRNRQIKTPNQGATIMNLAIWLPGLFVLGIVSIILFLAYTEGCARI